MLHSPEYRETHAADLKKLLPRIPLVVDARPFVDAGKELFEPHVGYESLAPYPIGGADVVATGDPFVFFRVEKMAYAKVREGGKLVPDKTKIKYNSRIEPTGIPADVQRYLLGPRTAVDWLIDRYQLRVDKASGNVNDRTTGPRSRATRATCSTYWRASSVRLRSSMACPR